MMLGLTVWSLYFFLKERWMLGAVSFCSALLFKQMALYYALPVFIYLLAQCARRPNG
jgi:alpha-1,3-glucosyltransferase